MDNFKAIYLILEVLEKSLDSELNEKDLNPENFGITEQRRNNLLEMLQNKGYITGLKIYNTIGYQRQFSLHDIRITLDGLEYLEDNSMMKKAYNVLKGIKDVTPFI